MIKSRQSEWCNHVGGCETGSCWLAAEASMKQNTNGQQTNMAISIKLKYGVMGATRFEKINPQPFLYSPLGCVSFRHTHTQKKNLWLRSTCFTTFLLTLRISFDLFCIVIGITFNEHVICNRLTHCDFRLSGNAS